MNQKQLESIKTITKIHSMSSEKEFSNMLSSQTDLEENVRVKGEKKENEIARHDNIESYHNMRMKGSKLLKNEGDEMEMEIDISS